MPTNDFLPWATAGGANVLAQADYATEAARNTGVVAGVGRSILANKTWRQSSSIAALVGQFINDYGGLDALDNGNIANLERDFVRALQQASFLLGVSSGTANAWVLTPVPSVAAYAAGRPMLVAIPATNTSTTVNANVSTLGNRRIKKADGTDPAIGDLIAGRMVWCADDGASIRVLTQLASDIVAAPRLAKAQIFRAPAATNSVPSGVTTKITNFGTVKNTLSDLAAWDGTNKKLMIAAGGDGVYDISVTLDTNLALGTAYGMSMSVGKNGGASIVGLNLQSASTGYLGPFGSASRTVELVAGDYLEVFAGHNFGSSQNFLIDFVVKFVGRS